MKITELDNHYDSQQMGTYGVSVLNDNKPNELVTIHVIMIVTGICDSETYLLLIKPYFQRRTHHKNSDIAQKVADIAQEMMIS